MPSKFYEHNAKSGLKDKRRLSVFIDVLISKYMKNVRTAELTYVFCSDDFLLEMNRSFLEHDTYTDIITFDLTEYQNELQGEIYISVARVKENAKKYNTTYNDELHRVIFHGVLHLCGFKDKKEKDQMVMRENEDYCLARYKKEMKK
ncbi:MAG: ybeY [Flavipsychrobacter sp.]|jgi:rRNA maturation RNase YbeY|nr:ybeY [Flavipsychrobacter sp.]